MIRVLTDRNAIHGAQAILEVRLKLGAEASDRVWVGYQGGAMNFCTPSATGSFNEIDESGCCFDLAEVLMSPERAPVFKSCRGLPPVSLSILKLTSALGYRRTTVGMDLLPTG